MISINGVLTGVILALSVSAKSTLKNLRLPHPKLDSRLQFRQAKAFAPATPLRPASNSVSLNKSSSVAPSNIIRNVISNSSVPLLAKESGTSYAISIDFGGQPFSVIFDTGSSDLWLPRSNVTCYDFDGSRVPVSACNFGPLFDGDYSEGTIADENFSIVYGDGEFLTGDIGFESVCVGPIEVLKQEVALVDRAYWIGDGTSSGLMGFAYPSLTSAYQGTDPLLDDPDGPTIPYNNWLFSAIAQGSIGPMFSVILDRGETGIQGELALGGLPPSLSQENNGNVSFASTPLQIMDLTNHNVESTQYSYYTIVPDGFTLSPAPASSSSSPNSTLERISTTFPTIVDSGTTLSYLPTTLVTRLAAAFQPAATYDSVSGLYEASCAAIPPAFAVTVGGVDVPFADADLLLQGDLGRDTSTEMCVLGVQSLENVFILGDTFLKNVIAVFDLGAAEMRFASR